MLKNLIKKLFFVLVLFLLIGIFNEKVFSGCSGAYWCGTTVPKCKTRCGIGGSDCEQQYCDNIPATCVYCDVCEDNSVGFYCQGSTSFACLNSGNCGIGYCSGPSSVSCAWSDPPPVPTNTPTPIPTIAVCDPLGCNTTDCGTCHACQNDGGANYCAWNYNCGPDWHYCCCLDNPTACNGGVCGTACPECGEPTTPPEPTSTLTPTPTMGVPVPNPASCNSKAAGTVNLSWSLADNATSYELRVNNQSNGWKCFDFPSDYPNCCTTPYPGDVCTSVDDPTSSYDFSYASGIQYNWWMAAWRPPNDSGIGVDGTDFICNLAITPVPTVPYCSISNRSPASNLCYKNYPTLSANRNSPADQIRFVVDDSNPIGGGYSCSSGWLSANPAYFTCPTPALTTRTYYWTAQAQSSTGLCTTSSLTSPTPIAFGVDRTAPEPPENYNAWYSSGNLNFNWDASPDIGCLNCSGYAAKYWLRGKWSSGTWIIDNGEWPATDCTNPLYSVSCLGRNGQTFYLLAKQAKDNYAIPGNLNSDNESFDTDPTDNFYNQPIPSVGTSYRCPTSTPTPTLTPTITPTAGPWKKISRSSYQSKTTGELNNFIPIDPIIYDTDDSGEPYFIVNKTGKTNEAGVASAPEITIAPATILSDNDWSIPSYSSMFSYNKTVFLGYINSRKTNKVITDLAEITADGIYKITGNQTITNDFGDNNIVLIVDGNVTINSNPTFNPSGYPLAIIADSITFTDTIDLANGIFIADNIITAESTTSLKIKGNLIAFLSLENNRDLADNRKPSLFIVFDPKQYFALLPYLSVAKYDWQQLQ